MNMAAVPDWFSTLYSPVVVEDSDLVDRRYRGVVAASKAVDDALVKAAIKLAIGWHTPLSVEASTRFRSYFNKIDDQFPDHGNDLELQLLGVALLIKVAEGGPMASLAALALCTASVGGYRATTLARSPGRLGADALADLAQQQRVRPVLEEIVAQEPAKVDFDKATTIATEGDVGKAISLVGEAVRAAFRSTNAKQTAAVAQVNQFLRAQDDELQVLWWLMSGLAICLPLPFDTVPEVIRPVVLAADLAHCSSTNAGLLSIDGFLLRAKLSANAKQKLVDVVNALPRDLAEHLSENTAADVLTLPMHLAIARRLETSEEVNWIAGWAAATGLPADIEMSALDVAKQFYRERLIARAA